MIDIPDEEANVSLYAIIAYVGFVIAILFHTVWGGIMLSWYFGSLLDSIDSEYDGTDTNVNSANSYQADDASGIATSGKTDDLIQIQMTGRDTLSWTFVRIQLSVGVNAYKCGVVEGVDGDTCYIDQQGGSLGTAWEPGEIIILAENGVDLVTGPGTTVGIHITFNGNTVAGDGAAVVN